MNKKYFASKFVFLLIGAVIMLPDTAIAVKKKDRRAAASAEKPAGEEPEAKKPKGLPPLSASPYLGSILIDATTGKVLSEDNADRKGYPASIIKLMNLLIILEHVKNGSVNLQDKVTVTAEASKTGGSQVYLKEQEVFTVDELLYALMVQSANDAAVALATHLSGTKDAFVELMNAKAKQLGMSSTEFHSVHGLPPGKDQLPDISTPRDIATLCRELLKWPDVLRYTSTKERPFRPDAAEPFIMRNHNHLLDDAIGCDGFKTGYFRAGGFSIAATASKKGARAIAVVLGCENRKVRDAETKELLMQGVAELVRTAPPPPTPPVIKDTSAAVKKTADNATSDKDVIQISKSTLMIIGIATTGLLVLIFIIAMARGRKKKDFLND